MDQVANMVHEFLTIYNHPSPLLNTYFLQALWSCFSVTSSCAQTHVFVNAIRVITILLWACMSDFLQCMSWQNYLCWAPRPEVAVKIVYREQSVPFLRNWILTTQFVYYPYWCICEYKNIKILFCIQYGMVIVIAGGKKEKKPCCAWCSAGQNSAQP